MPLKLKIVNFTNMDMRYRLRKASGPQQLALQKSIREDGLLSPPIITPRPWWAFWRKEYTVVSGFLRIDAMVAIGYKSCACTIVHLGRLSIRRCQLLQ